MLVQSRKPRDNLHRHRSLLRHRQLTASPRATTTTILPSMTASSGTGPWTKARVVRADKSGHGNNGTDRRPDVDYLMQVLCLPRHFHQTRRSL